MRVRGNPLSPRGHLAPAPAHVKVSAVTRRIPAVPTPRNTAGRASQVSSPGTHGTATRATSEGLGWDVTVGVKENRRHALFQGALLAGGACDLIGGKCANGWVE